MTKNIHVYSDKGFAIAKVVLGDGKVNAIRKISTIDDVVVLTMTDHSDKTGDQKVNVQIAFKTIESVEILEGWLAGIRDQFNYREAQKIVMAFEAKNK